MPTTSNFGWTTPADTDLVKDGAAAIRTLGNGIDTSLVDLKGGTTGQNLRKNSNTDLDFTWAGDATNTVIDAEGDLLVGDTADTLQRLAIGTTGQVLTVDTALDGKIKWATPTSPAFVGASAYIAGTNITYVADTPQALSLTNENWDTDSMHSNSTNPSRITIASGKGGYYQINAMCKNTGPTAYFLIRITKNGSPFLEFANNEGARIATSGTVVLSTSGCASLAAGDYIELVAQMGGNGTIETHARLDVFKVG